VKSGVLINSGQKPAENDLLAPAPVVLNDVTENQDLQVRRALKSVDDDLDLDLHPTSTPTPDLIMKVLAIQNITVVTTDHQEESLDNRLDMT